MLYYTIIYIILLYIIILFLLLYITIISYYTLSLFCSIFLSFLSLISSSSSALPYSLFPLSSHPLLLFFQSLSPLPYNPHQSLYTCRYLHTLIYIVLLYSHLLLRYSSNPLPLPSLTPPSHSSISPQFIQYVSVLTQPYLYSEVIPGMTI